MKNITLPNWYLRLAKTVAERQKKYRKLFHYYLRTEGLEKKSFVRALYFGPADWQEERRQIIKQYPRPQSHSP